MSNIVLFNSVNVVVGRNRLMIHEISSLSVLLEQTLTVWYRGLLKVALVRLYAQLCHSCVMLL